MRLRLFSVRKKYRPVFVGEFEQLRRPYNDAYNDIARADRRAKTVVEEGGAIESIVYEELGKDRRIRKITYQRADNGEIMRTTNI
jgi:hypothetical protein